MKKVDDNFSELKSLLRATEGDVPHRDLKDQFLQDLHHRIDSHESSPTWSKINFPQLPKFAWAGASLAAIAIAVLVGVQHHNASSDIPQVASVDSAASAITFVNMDDRIDSSSFIPQFVAKPTEF